MAGRRLPVYLVLDTSGSMSGQPIEAVKQGVSALVADLQGDPQALETAYLSVITFDSDARQVCPLTDLMSFQPPNLVASGITSFGEAIDVLMEAMDREVQKGSPDVRGDWKPLVFIMTDGEPTDDWEKKADRLKQAKLGNIIACAAGANANESMLKKVTEIVVKLDTLQPDALAAFFAWVSASIKTSSTKVTTNPTEAEAGLDLPAPPPTITIIP